MAKSTIEKIQGILEVDADGIWGPGLTHLKSE